MDSDNTMASALKRKRAPVEVSETPKRIKSVESKSKNVLGFIGKISGWEAAFNPPASTTNGLQENGVNGHVEESDQQAASLPQSASKKSRKREKKLKALAPSEIRVEENPQDSQKPRTGLASPEVQDYDDFIDHESREEDKNQDTLATLGDPERAPSKAARMREAAARWKLSEPIGGRMINLDPVFSVDEKCAIFLPCVWGFC